MMDFLFRSLYTKDKEFSSASCSPIEIETNIQNQAFNNQFPELSTVQSVVFITVKGSDYLAEADAIITKSTLE